MKVLVVGSGGREHALIHALHRSPQRPELLCAPGNPGIAASARILEVGAEDIDGQVRLARDEHIDLVVVGPEAPLVAGLVDALAENGVRAVGPTAAAAQLEGSKEFAKRAMAGAGVPTASWTAVQTVEEGLAAITGYPVVVKADGLAAGKGVTVAPDEATARAALEDLLVQRRFGTETVIVEECLVGEELSLFALCDGERAVPMTPARDYKRIFDGDRGPNTGGMGSFSPVPGIEQSLVAEIIAQVHQPVVDYMRERGTPFRGVLYGGLMLTPAGIRVIEFNVRFGDPEAQALLPRLRSDLLDALVRTTAPAGLAGYALDWSAQWGVMVVLASAGYPESPRAGDEISGLEDVPSAVEVTHAGTALRDGRLVTSGGRVLGIAALGDDPAGARRSAYAAAQMISFAGRQMRTDIAERVAAAGA
ncbi:MAG: phosphoribosylamine--glycine ligase [Solirubrobacteraceae bacterium]|jgi:phosphoribosylamine--glycine ligase